MHFKSWLHSVRTRLRASNNRRRSHAEHKSAIERLEDRTLLTVTALFLDGELTVITDGLDSVSIQEDPDNPGFVQVVGNGSPLSSVNNVTTASITSIEIRGGNNQDTIDLSGVTGSAFTNLATIQVDGGDGADNIVGSPFADNILGGDGDDTINGQAGDDTINGQDGDDQILGDSGNDSLVGEDGHDDIGGGDGGDIISGGDGQDTIAGGNGSDSITAGASRDVVDGGDGSDTISGGFGSDTLDGGSGNDVIEGNMGADSISGGDDDDTLRGIEHDDTLLGGDGNDRLEGGGNNDSLIGGSGDDTLIGAAGRDNLNGGDGNDRVQGGAERDVIFGGNGDDTLRGQGGADTMFGGLGLDIIDGGAGNDVLDSVDRGFRINDVIIDPEGPGGTTNLTVFSTDFEDGIPPEFSGVGFVDLVQGYEGVGLNGNNFSGSFLRNDSGGTVEEPGSVPSSPITLTLTDLPSHTSIDLNFLFAAINSWDGLPEVTGPDFFNVSVDGDLVFRENFRNLGPGQGYVPPGGGLLTPSPFTDLGFGPEDNQPDTGYNLGLDSDFNNIPHTADTLVIEFFADGSFYEGGNNESFAIENVEVILNETPLTTDAVFTVNLQATLEQDVSVQFATNSGTALAGDDFISTQGTVTIPAGSTSASIRVPVIGDDIEETTEEFTVSLFNPVGTTIAVGEGTGTIIDDDGVDPDPDPTPGNSEYDIDVQFAGGLTPSQQAVFATAAQRLQDIIIGDLPDVAVPGFGQVDDVVILAQGMDIDGPGGILGAAGPTAVRAGTFLPSAGVMQFDTADLAGLEASGALQDTILHEMLHVLGFGTIWQQKNLLINPASGGGTDPRFVGPQATAEYNSNFALNEADVPVEAMGGPGTADGHWRESVFNSELMTGFLSGSVRPISAMTVASLADLGYVVDISQADPYAPGSIQQSTALALQNSTLTKEQLEAFPTGGIDIFTTTGLPDLSTTVFPTRVPSTPTEVEATEDGESEESDTSVVTSSTGITRVVSPSFIFGNAITNTDREFGRIVALDNLDLLIVDPLPGQLIREANVPRKQATKDELPLANITATGSGNATSLANALIAGGGTGIIVNGGTLSGNSDITGAISSGLYTVDSTPDVYDLTRDGIILSTGDIADYTNGPNTSVGLTTSYNTPATAGQELLLDQITGGQFQHFDVTQLDINFDMEQGFDTVFFEVAFGSEEFPEFVGSSFVDGFGLFLNGENIATVNGAAVNISHPDFQAIPGTELDGILAPNGNGRLLFQAPVGDGSVNNTLTIILADTSDTLLDTTVYVSSLGATNPNAPTDPGPPPVPTNFQGDTLIGAEGNDILRGADGDDLLLGGAGQDSMNGGNGNDVLFGGADNDLLEGGGGDDELRGQGGDDSIDGGIGQDQTLWRGSIDGNDSVNGGADNDELEVRGDSQTDRITLSQSLFVDDPTMTSELLITEGTSTLTVINTDSSASNTGEPLNTVETIRINGNNGN
ncbi:MAG: hypothetical protein CMJ78_22400, partial [Planctomycetaceae bacterium]|nr:hypothetical protein [Planctomycetaceae bacterium]